MDCLSYLTNMTIAPRAYQKHPITLADIADILNIASRKTNITALFAIMMSGYYPVKNFESLDLKYKITFM